MLMSARLVQLAILTILMSGMFLLSIQGGEKKRLYIAEITPGEAGLYSKAEAARDFITLSILENHGSVYRLITEKEKRLLFSQETAMPEKPCTDEICLSKLAAALKTEELIAGKVVREKNHFRLILTNYTGKGMGKNLAVKSEVSLAFFENQTEWACREAGKKMIQPDYEIDSEKAVTDYVSTYTIGDKIREDKKGLDQSLLLMKSADKDAQSLLDALKEALQDSDIRFLAEDYQGAFEGYNKILEQLLKADENQKHHLKPFTEGIQKRIADTQSLVFKSALKDILQWLSAHADTNEEVCNKVNSRYRELLSEYYVITEEERRFYSRISPSFARLETEIYLSWTAFYEIVGDYEYNRYRFKDSLNAYDKGISIILVAGIFNEDLVKQQKRLERKKNRSSRVASSWLESKMLAYCSRGQHHLLKNENKLSDEAFERAGYMLGYYQDFAKPEMKELYNKRCTEAGYDNSGIEGNIRFYRDNQDNYFGTMVAVLAAPPLLAYGTAYFFNQRVKKSNSDYSKLKSQYERADDINEGTEIYDSMEGKKEDARKYALYRNISLGVGLALTALHIYYVLKYMRYNYVKYKFEEMNSEVSLYISSSYMDQPSPYSRKDPWNTAPTHYLGLTCRF